MWTGTLRRSDAVTMAVDAAHGLGWALVTNTAQALLDRGTGVVTPTSAPGSIRVRGHLGTLSSATDVTLTVTDTAVQVWVQCEPTGGFDACCLFDVLRVFACMCGPTYSRFI